MQKEFCEVTGKEILPQGVNHGRTPTVCPLPGTDKSLHILVVERDGRCNQCDLSTDGFIEGLTHAISVLKPKK